MASLAAAGSSDESSSDEEYLYPGYEGEEEEEESLENLVSKWKEETELKKREEILINIYQNLEQEKTNQLDLI